MFTVRNDGDGITATFKFVEGAALISAIELAKNEIAKLYWEQHKTEIMAQMDLKGMASLIAVYAAREMVPDKK